MSGYEHPNCVRDSVCQSVKVLVACVYMRKVMHVGERLRAGSKGEVWLHKRGLKMRAALLGMCCSWALFFFHSRVLCDALQRCVHTALGVQGHM